MDAKFNEKMANRASKITEKFHIDWNTTTTWRELIEAIRDQKERHGRVNYDHSAKPPARNNHHD